MFHVFDGTDDTGPNTGGTEVFAYIPSALFNNSVDDGGKPKGIRALTFQDGGAPIFKHHFYVNALAACDGRRLRELRFRQRVHAGLADDRRGRPRQGRQHVLRDRCHQYRRRDRSAGRGKGPLGIQRCPAASSRTAAPIIAKTRADGWVVVVASGYNNTDDGKGTSTSCARPTGR